MNSTPQPGRVREDAGGGTQAIARAAGLLRLIARRGAEGSRLTDLTRMAGLPHPTVRRILKCLIEERLVVQDEATRRYQLGPLNFELGLATQHRSGFQRSLRPVLERLAGITGDTAYLHVRSGADAVCLDRIEGHYPIRALILDIGGRRPLCFGAAGQALLARLDDAEINEVLATHAREIANHGRLTTAGLRRAIERTRTRGYGLAKDTTVLGVSSIGIVVTRQDGQPSAMISLAMVNDRLTPSRALELHALMRQELREALGGDDAL